jgi:hypothetical protein
MERFSASQIERREKRSISFQMFRPADFAVVSNASLQGQTAFND